jgi:uncharacterized protein (DUF1697 family)
MATTHILLPRGINVAANNRIGMAALRTALEEAGFTGVKTYLQSGNVVVTSSSSSPAVVGREVEELITREFGHSVKVVVRSRKQIEKIVAKNPFADVADEGKRYFVTFCDPAPDPAKLAHLDPAEFEPERWLLDGDTLYTWYATGLQNSKLDKAISRAKLGVTVTARNWNTVTKLLDLAEE